MANSSTTTVAILVAAAILIIVLVAFSGVNRQSASVEAPGTRVETSSDETRVQVPGVDIRVPNDKD
jgi:hypothetical protein